MAKYSKKDRMINYPHDMLVEFNDRKTSKRSRTKARQQARWVKNAVLNDTGNNDLSMARSVTFDFN